MFSFNMSLFQLILMIILFFNSLQQDTINVYLFMMSYDLLLSLLILFFILAMIVYWLFCFKKDQISSDEQQKEQLAQEAHKRSIYHFNRENYAQAIEYQEKSLQIIKITKGLINSQAALRCDNIAVACAELKNYEKAKIYVLQAQNIRQIINENELTKVVNLYTAGVIQNRLNNRERARHYLEQVKQLMFRNHQQTNDQMAKIYYEIAQIDFAEQKFADAVENYTKCLQMKIKLNGKDTQENATIMKNIATAQYHLQNHTQSNALYLNALKIQTIKKPKPIEERAITLANLGELQFSQGRYKQAIGVFQNLLQEEFQKYGQRGIHSRETLSKIGSSFSRLGKYGKAQRYYNQVINLSEAYKLKDESYCYSLFGLGVLYNSLKDYKTSQLSLKKCLKLADQVRDKDLIIQTKEILKLQEEEMK